MKIFSQEEKKQLTENKKGSSIVMLSIIFAAFALCITGAIGVARMLTVRSECEVFGRVWTKAILSEYDRHLMEDYAIMAYFGNESEVQSKIDLYLEYSAANKLNASIKGSSSELYGYELGDPKNFRKALSSSLASYAVENILKGNKRTKRPDKNNGNFGKRDIKDRVVISTLPSEGIRNTVDVQGIIDKAKSGINSSNIYEAFIGYSAEIAFIKKYFGSKVTYVSEKPCYFQNEMEYVLIGKIDDEVNRKACRRRILLIRNALNLASIYKDPEKLNLIKSVANIITPGPGSAITEVIIAEAWALYETEKDIDDLYDNRRVPLIKTVDNWKTDLKDILDTDQLRSKLDDESKKQLDEKGNEIKKIASFEKGKRIVKEGLTYDEYLMMMIMSLNDNVRLLRIMDIVQINMKYRHYRDFNMMEYFIGVRFSIEANGRSYDFEDYYK
ncbi:MAG TPA: hypothetical protein GX736_06675 [Mogibacterium sp.]|nr:hypothetical protein [Mogibacterium sp.]